MTVDELREAIQYFFDNETEIGVSVYAILKGSESDTPKKVDIEGAASEGLKALFLSSLREAILDREGLSTLNLSASDERLNAVYVYDIDLPDELSAIENVIAVDNLPLLNLADARLANIKALLIEIGDNESQIVLYKTMAPVNIFGRGSLFLRNSKTRLEKINDEFLRISSGFQLMRVDGVLIVIDLEAVERSFGFHDVIKREAASGIDAIEGMQLIENPQVLHELIDDVRYARRFTKVAKASPVIKAKVPNNTIINFCKTFPKLAGRIRFNAVGDRIVLDTNISKDLFIKLLMDDYLTSDLTKFHYESVAKDSVDEAADDAD